MARRKLRILAATAALTGFRVPPAGYLKVLFGDRADQR